MAPWSYDSANTKHYALFGIQTGLLVMYFADLALSCAGVGQVRSFFADQEAWDTDYFPIYWGWYTYTAVVGLGIVGYFGCALERLLDQNCKMADVISLPSVSFTVAMACYNVSLLTLSLEVNPWVSWAFELVGALAGVYCLWAIRKYP